MPAAVAPTRVELSSVSVDQAVAEALEHNLVLLAERYRVPLARAELVTAKLRLNPVLSLGADHLDLLGTGYNTINNAGPQEFFLRTDVLFRAGRKRQRKMDVAEKGITVAELELRDAVRRVILDVQLACIEVQLADAAVELANKNLELFRRVVALNQTRVDSGDLAKVELTRAQIAELQANNELTQAQGARRIAHNNLALLLGRMSTGQELRVTGEMRDDRTPLVLGEIRQEALRMRPDFRAVRSEQVLIQSDIRRQIAEGKVDVSVGLEVRRQQGLAGTGNSLGFFLGVPLRIFDRNQGEIERARQRGMQVETRLSAAEQAIRVEVDNAYIEYQTARDLLASVEGGMLQKAEQVVATAEYAYRRGEASLIELLDAQRAFNETRRSYNQARAAYARALYTIDAVTARKVPP